jgi:hypothetical protein
MTMLKLKPVVIESRQIDSAEKPNHRHLPEEVNPPLFLERKRSLFQMLKALFSKAVFTVGLYLKFIGGKK